jgi:hypothetical protein
MATMPTFFLNVLSDRESFLDKAGVELSDYSDAHWYALALISRLMSHGPRQDWSKWKVEVTDPEGHVVLTVVFPSHVRHISRAAVRERLEAVLPSAADGSSANQVGSREEARHGHA